MMNYADDKRRVIADYYQTYRDELTAYVRKATCGAEESEDIVQETFLRLLLTDKMVSEVTLPCLVFTIARNMVSDYWRHHSAIDRFEHYVKQNANDDTKAQYVYSTFEIKDILEGGMKKLRENQREIYRMNIIDDMKISDIVKITGEGYKSVEARLGKARKIMREYVARRLA